MAALAEQYRVIDTDTHIIEPYDLWQSRVSVKKWGDKVPHVRMDENTQEEAWFFGKVRTLAAAGAAMAGWTDYPPNRPKKLEYVNKDLYEPAGRLKLMDQTGIHAQILYPNAAGFGAGKFLALADHDLMLECVKVYNDWVSDYASADPRRFHPMTALPFWDTAETIKEMERCAKKGHKGIIMCGEPEVFKLPKLTDPHWDPMWAAAESMGQSVNFHVGAGDMWYVDMMHPRVGKHAAFASMGALFSLDLAAVVSQLTCGGICHAYPKLNFVLVESGVGWIPYLLAGLDYQWLNCGAHKENPEYKLIPSEFFKRQIYGAFWFERETLKPAIDIVGADNILYETDFPHPTSMFPGPATSAINPRDYIEGAFKGVSAGDTAKILHDNAARIYHID